MMTHSRCISWLVGVLAWHALPVAAADGAPDWDARFQSTYVWQAKPAFRAAYSGEHSLDAAREKSYTFTATGYFGWRLAPSTELYFNPEVVQGVLLSRLQGLGGFTNGEAQKTSGSRPTVYVARAFVRHTWNLGGEAEPVEADKNQLAGAVDSNRVVLTAGNFAVTDIFDRSDHSGDPRVQFLNWSFLTHAAFDFPADARGYTWGAALEWWRGDWQLRAARFLLPKEPNGTTLDRRGFRHYGDVLEVVRSYRIGERGGNVRLLAFRDRAVMARYDDALALAAAAGGPPSLDAVRLREQSKRGAGIAIDQMVTADAGMFVRAMRADGATEVEAFTEADRSLSAGAVLRGAAWDRQGDTVGVALGRNGLSSAHRAYLGAGGLGFFLGDGRLAYRQEQVVELFYSAALGRHAWVTLDWQRIANPGYNADRGPARVTSLRLHAEF